MPVQQDYVNYDEKNKNQLNLPLKKRRKFPEKKVIPDEQALGFASRSTINCSFPQLQPKNSDGSFVTHWERKNGNSTLTLTANPKYGLPAGKDRLFAIWLKTKAVMSGSSVVYFKDGASILKEIGLDPEGDNKIWLNGVINRFTHTVMSYEEGNKFRGGSFEGSLIIKKMNGYFDKRTWNRNERSYFVLGDLFEKVPGIPVDLNSLRRLGRAWFTIDLYTFINYRLWFETRDALAEEDLSKRKPLRIPMREYREQSGAPLTVADKTYRQDLRKAFKRIVAIQGFKASLDENDVITVPIIRPVYVWTAKNQEAMKSFHDALTRLESAETVGSTT